MREYTVVLIKPDGVRKGIVGDILRRFERVGLKIAAAKMVWVDGVFVGKHYKDDKEYLKTVGRKTLESYKKYGHDPNENLGTKDPLKIGKNVRKWSMDYLSSGPLFALILSGPNAITITRKIIGNTFPADASPGTIRGDFAIDSSHQTDIEKRAVENIIHTSGSKEEAEFERKLWFREMEIYSY